MKKLIFLFSAFLIFCLQTALAQNITLSLEGSSFIAGQTVIAKIGMERFSISKLSLLDSSNAKVPVGFYNYNYAKNENYAYFNLPSTLSGTYKLLVSERIMEAGVLKESNASAVFPVSAGNAFTITPVAVKISPASSYFKISLRHTAGSPLDVAVSVSDNAIKPVRNSLSLAVNEMKTLTVNYDGLNLKNDAILTLSSGAVSYNIPLFAPKAANETAQNQSIEETVSFEGALVTVKNITVIKNSAPVNRLIAGPLEFRNNAKSALHDVTFTSSGISSLEFNQTSVPVLEPGTVYSQYIWMNRQKDAAPGKYFGTITAASREGASLSIPLEIEFTAIAQEQPNETSSQQNVTMPLEKPGKVTVEKVNVSLGIPIVNFTELKETSAAEKRKNLVIALTISAFVIAIAFLFFYRIRPKTTVRKMGEYAEEIGKPRKK
ncbi:MAG: hypothetical protein QME12_06725 [Nanoarchaeota archaeon]|nr:hypothetical protein [Nanoarchaeota archaeon]